MAKAKDGDPNYSPEQSEMEEMADGVDQLRIQQQQSVARSHTATDYARHFSLHEKVATSDKFPIHSYLKQGYNTLSLEDRINIFDCYFQGKELEHQLKLQPAHIKKLNDSINLFKNLPTNPLLFLTIQPSSSTQEVLTFKNYNGEIVHFKTVSRQKKRSTIISQSCGTLKGRPFLVIADYGDFNNRWLNRKTFEKLGQRNGFYYIKKIKCRGQLQQMRKEFFKNGGQGSPHFEINFSKNNQFFYAYGENHIEDQDLAQKTQYLEQLEERIKYLMLEQERLVGKETRKRPRLRTLDSLFINYIKVTEQSRQQFIQFFMKMQKKYGLKDVNEEKDHFVKIMHTSKRCKNCEIMGRRNNKKSKYKCMACSKKFRVDIPLCLECNGDFHELVLPYVREASAKDMKKVYEANKHRKIDITQNSSQSNKTSNKKTEQLETLNRIIRKLDLNMTEIQKLMDQLQADSYEGAKIAKQFNEAIFVDIMNCFADQLSSYGMFDEGLSTPGSIEDL